MKNITKLNEYQIENAVEELLSVCAGMWNDGYKRENIIAALHFCIASATNKQAVADKESLTAAENKQVQLLRKSFAIINRANKKGTI
jgi:hypothetical protein